MPLSCRWREGITFLHDAPIGCWHRSRVRVAVHPVRLSGGADFPGFRSSHEGHDGPICRAVIISITTVVDQRGAWRVPSSIQQLPSSCTYDGPRSLIEELLAPRKWRGSFLPAIYLLRLHLVCDKESGHKMMGSLFSTGVSRLSPHCPQVVAETGARVRGSRLFCG